MKPKSIAVLGASNRPGIGNAFVKNLVNYGYKGSYIRLIPTCEVVSSIKTYPSIMDVPGEVDLAILVVAAEKTQSLVEECARKGVKVLVAITAGFSEMGGEGIEREKKLIHTARAYGMRVIGPNCLGILNTDPDITHECHIRAHFPAPWQSGVRYRRAALLGAALLLLLLTISVWGCPIASASVTARMCQTTSFCSTGRRTKIPILFCFILSPLEIPEDLPALPAKPRQKTHIVVKGGSSSAGARAAASHTGAMMSMDIVSDALFRQTGMIRCNTLEKLFNAATFLANQPLPKGKKVAVLTNGGGAGIMAADALSAEGFQLPILSEKTRNELKTFLPPKASYLNPIDTTAAVSPEQYKRTLKLLLEEDIDAVIALYIPPIRELLDGVKIAIREVAPEFRKKGIPVMASFMGVEEGEKQLSGPRRKATFPYVLFPKRPPLSLRGPINIMNTYIRRQEKYQSSIT